MRQMRRHLLPVNQLFFASAVRTYTNNGPLVSVSESAPRDPRENPYLSGEFPVEMVLPPAFYEDLKTRCNALKKTTPCTAEEKNIYEITRRYGILDAPSDKEQLDKKNSKLNLIAFFAICVAGFYELLVIYNEPPCDKPRKTQPPFIMNDNTSDKEEDRLGDYYVTTTPSN